MINLNIDTQALAEEFTLSKEDVDHMTEFVVDEITTAFARQWDNEAKENLHSARNQYRNSIQVTKRGRFTGVVYLNPAAWLPNALEMGANEFDMKAGFMASPKVKYDKSGNPYLTIPFRFATPGSLGESSAFVGVMPTIVHRAVKVAPTRPLSIGQIPRQYHMPVSASLRRRLKSTGFATLSANTKTTSIYEGLQQNTKGTGYVMFRRVSLNSPAERFIHPGFVPRKLADKALGNINIPHQVDVAIDSYLNNAGF